MPVYFFQMADSETPKVDQVVGDDDEDDPAVIVTWAADDEIMNAMALPERPNSLGMGANAAACKQALVAWLDTNTYQELTFVLTTIWKENWTGPTMG